MMQEKLGGCTGPLIEFAVRAILVQGTFTNYHHNDSLEILGGSSYIHLHIHLHLIYIEFELTYEKKEKRVKKEKAARPRLYHRRFLQPRNNFIAFSRCIRSAHF